MGRCCLCNRFSGSISREIGVCAGCIKERPEEAAPLIRKSHIKSRMAYALPEEPPRDPDGLHCSICINECRIPDGGVGYCGLRRNEGGRLRGVSSSVGKLSWYHDPLPTNCVADWVCAGGSGAGYPEYANRPGPEYGYKNLAVFFHACSFNCLYCQNWHFREQTLGPHTSTVEGLVSAVDERTSCICYFGGDPSPQLPFAIRASRMAIDRYGKRTLRICWETNGSMNKGLLKEMVSLSLETGGCIKFDLKAWDENIHIALTGVSNRRTLENFRMVGEMVGQRPSPPLLVASTLLVPGYVEEDEIRGIARFIAEINPEIPYCLLAFYPHFYMSDMPLITKQAANNCLRIAHEQGLKNVRIGNLHLLKG